jgi:hypothetical protein
MSILIRGGTMVTADETKRADVLDADSCELFITTD